MLLALPMDGLWTDRVLPRALFYVHGSKCPCICYHTKVAVIYAGVAELVDALGLGSSGIPVKVRVLSPAPSDNIGFIVNWV